MEANRVVVTAAGVVLLWMNCAGAWDEVAKYAVATPESIKRVATILNKYTERFLFGTDTVAPTGPDPYHAVFDMWAPCGICSHPTRA